MRGRGNRVVQCLCLSMLIISLTTAAYFYKAWQQVKQVEYSVYGAAMNSGYTGMTKAYDATTRLLHNWDPDSAEKMMCGIGKLHESWKLLKRGSNK